MKKNKFILIILGIGIIYYILSSITHIYIPCIFHEITHLYCPGCGVTRMITNLLQGNIKESFQNNQLLFLSLPFFLYFIIEMIIANFKDKIPLYKKIPNWIYIIYLILLILFMILRNIFPIFAPISI